MQLHQTIIFSLVEGVTEFLPISSTFHLLLTASFLHLPQTEFLKLFEVVIQSGAILALSVRFWHTLQQNKTYPKSIFFALIPTLGAGFVLYKLIKSFFFENLLLTSTIFTIVGLLMLVIDHLPNISNQERKLAQMTNFEALFIGSFQALAVIPGVSRAGSVLIGMKLMGYQYQESAIFTFLLGFPTIIFASAFDLYKNFSLVQNLTSQEISMLIIGTIVSALTAYMVLDWFLKFLQSHNLFYFGLYRVVFGVIILYSLLN